MTIAFGTAGTLPAGTGTGTGTTSVTPAAPSSMATGDIVLIFVENKPDTSTPTTPTGWTLVATVAGGGGTAGSDAGPVRMTCFSRVKDASWSTMPAITITSANGSWAQAFRYTNATGAWSVAATTGTDTSSGTGFSCAGGANPGITTGDWLVAGCGVTSDTPTWGTHTLTATGATIGARTERGEPKTTQGNDMGGAIWDAACSAGNSSGNPTAGATLSSSTGSTGVGIIVRLREVAAPDNWTEDVSDSVGLTDSATVDLVSPVTLANSFDNGTDDTDITTGNSGTSGDAFHTVGIGTSGTIKYSAATTIRGSKSARVVGNGTDQAYVQYQLPAAANSATVRAYFRHNGAALHDTAALHTLRLLNNSTSVVATVYMGVSGVLLLTDSTGATIHQTSAGFIQPGVTYRIQMQATQGVPLGTLGYKVWDDTDTLLLDQSFPDVDVDFLGIWRCRIGKVNSASNAVDMSIDEVAFTNQITDIPPVTAPSGTNHTVSTSDPAGLVDTATVSEGHVRTATDAVGLVDNAATSLGHVRSVSDAVGLVDSASVALVKTQAATDPVGLADSAQAVQTHNQRPTDSTGLTDSATVNITRPVTATDSAGLSDSAKASQSHVGTSTDAVGLTDTANIVLGIGHKQADTDSVGLVDDATIEVSKTVTGQDSAGLVDSASLFQAHVHKPTDSTGLSDNAQPSLGHRVLPTDSAGLTDSAVVVLVRSMSVTDSTGTTDAAVVHMEHVTAVKDSVALSDAAIVRQDHGRSTTDQVGLADSAVVSRGLGAPSVDSTGLTDKSTVGQGHNHSTQDPTGLADSVNVLLSVTTFVSAADAVGLSDLATLVLFRLLPINATDSVGLTDKSTINRGMNMSVTDSLALFDHFMLELEASLLVVDPTGLDDRSEVALDSPLGAQDSAGLSDDKVFVLVASSIKPATDPTAAWGGVDDTTGVWSPGGTSASFPTSRGHSSLGGTDSTARIEEP